MIRPDYREIKAICNSGDELFHYGVKGMKWGVYKKPILVSRIPRREGMINTIEKNDKAQRRADRPFKNMLGRVKLGTPNTKFLNNIKNTKNLGVDMDDEAKERGIRYYNSTINSSKGFYKKVMNQSVKVDRS